MPIKNSNFKSILKEKLHCGKIFNSFSSSRDCETKKEEPQPNFKKLFSVEQSQTILNRIKYLRIKKIFDTIDTEKIGFLNRKNIEEFRGEVQVMKILRPVLEDIMNKRLSVNLSEFEEKVDMLLMKLSSNERMALLDVKST